MSDAQNLWYDPESEDVPNMTGAESVPKGNKTCHPSDGSATVGSNVEQPGESEVSSPLTDMGTLQSALPEASGELDKQC